MVHGTQGAVGALALGERARINGREVARVGLWGSAAYLVDGAHVGATEAAALTEGPEVAVARDRAADECAARARHEDLYGPQPQPARVAFAPAPAAAPKAPVRRTRQARAEKPAPAPAPTSELLEEVRDALSAKRGLRFALRRFAGGEAVVVTSAAALSPSDLQSIIRKLVSTGLHAERGHDGASVVVAHNAKTLAQ